MSQGWSTAAGVIRLEFEWCAEQGGRRGEDGGIGTRWEKTVSHPKMLVDIFLRSRPSSLTARSDWNAADGGQGCFERKMLFTVRLRGGLNLFERNIGLTEAVPWQDVH